jgi:hypothetical protein
MSHSSTFSGDRLSEIADITKFDVIDSTCRNAAFRYKERKGISVMNFMTNNRQMRTVRDRKTRFKRPFISIMCSNPADLVIDGLVYRITENNWKRLCRPANASRQEVTKLRIAADICEIGEYCCASCENLCELTFEPESRLQRICESAFVRPR